MMSDLLNALFLEQTAEAAKTLAELIQTGKLADSATKTSETRKREANAFGNVVKDFTIPLIEAFKDRPNAKDSLRRTYSPTIIRLEAMIDARIDKALARLVNLKEYKRLAATYSPPLISADASTSSDLKDKSEVEHITSTTKESIFLK